MKGREMMSVRSHVIGLVYSFFRSWKRERDVSPLNFG
jgi:hypothetical protein